MLSDPESIKTVGDLIGALRRQASDHEESNGCDETVVGLLQAARLIDDSLGADTAIGGAPQDAPAPAQDTEEVERLREQLRQLVSRAGEREATIQRAFECMAGQLPERFDYAQEQAKVKELKQQLTILKPCPHCYGRGSVKHMFHELECLDCAGTGKAFDDPELLIKGLMDVIRAQELLIGRQMSALYSHALTADQREAMSVEAFYKDSKYRGD